MCFMVTNVFYGVTLNIVTENAPNLTQIRRIVIQYVIFNFHGKKINRHILCTVDPVAFLGGMTGFWLAFAL
jgi:hypothetical protein